MQYRPTEEKRTTTIICSVESKPEIVLRSTASSRKPHLSFGLSSRRWANRGHRSGRASRRNRSWVTHLCTALSEDFAYTTASSIILSNIDFCNSLLFATSYPWLLTFNVRSISSPPYPLYLHELLSENSSTRTVRSTSVPTLFVPRITRITLADRAFVISAPNVWNGLPPDVHVRMLSSKCELLETRLSTGHFADYRARAPVYSMT